MDLTVIILNFNVRYLLEPCLESVFQSIQSIPSEVIVVDNASTDESVAMVRVKFPQAVLLANPENVGFAKANNQAIHLAQGQHILILNPDTVINQAAITAGLNYLKQHDKVAAIGVKMIDGNGQYLEESKRGFPTIGSSLWKLTGINRWFPHNANLNHYYLGHLDQNGIHEVEVLTGAFFLVKKKVLQQLGGFDEGYYMYGEDIDLSHRIRQLGFQLVYLGNQTITHLKGRSSSAHSYQHVRNFYQAMLVFVKKYYRHPVTKWLMGVGIWLAGIFSWIKRQLFFHFLPLTDFILIGLSIYLVQFFWSRYWFDDPVYFMHPTFFCNAVVYGIIWMVSLFFIGAYRTQSSSPGYLGFHAIVSGTVIILVVYSLLPESWRTSRAIILICGIVLSVIIPLSRILLKPNGYGFRALLVGDETAEQRLNPVFRSLCLKNYFSYVSRLDISGPNQVPQLKTAILNQNITHVILPLTNLWKSDVLLMTRAGRNQINYMLEDPENKGVLRRSQTIPGLTEVDIRLNHPVYQWSKVWVNTMATLLILPWGWILPEIRKNFMQLALGKKHWVSYRAPVAAELPLQKAGLWHPPAINGSNEDFLAEVNFEYAANYHPLTDIRIILTNLIKIN